MFINQPTMRWIRTSLDKIFPLIVILIALTATAQVKPSFSRSNGPTILPGSNPDKSLGAKYIYQNVATVNIDGADYTIDAVLTIVDIVNTSITYLDKINGVDARFEPETNNTHTNGYVEWELIFVYDGTVTKASDKGVSIHLKEFTLEAIDVDGDEWFEAVVTNSYTLEDGSTKSKLAVTQNPDGYTRFTSTGGTVNGVSTTRTDYIVRIDYVDVDVINFRNGRLGRGNRLHSLGFQGEVVFDIEKTTTINNSPITVDKVRTETILDSDTFTEDLFAGATDVDGNIDKLTMHIVDPSNDGNQGVLGVPLTIPGQGTYTLVDVLNGGMNVVFVPENGFQGQAKIEFFVDDDLSVSSDRSVFSINVNDTPIAKNDVLSGNEGVTILGNIISGDNGNGPDLDATPASLEIQDFIIAGDPTVHSAGNTVVLAGKGEVTLQADGTFIFTPLFGGNFSGSLPEITYTLIDNGGGVATATVNVSVISVNDPPVAIGHGGETELGSSIKFHAAFNDTDSDGTIDNSSIDLDPSTPGQQTSFSKNGTWTVDGSGTVTFTPNSLGTISIDYTISDDLGAVSNIAQLTVIVNPLNDADGDGVSDKIDLDSDNDGILNTVEGFGAVIPVIPLSTYKSTTRTKPANGTSVSNPTNGYVVTDLSSKGVFAFKAVSRSEVGSGGGIGTVSYVTIDADFAPKETVNNVKVDFKVGSQTDPNGSGYFDEGFYIEINGIVVVNFNYLQYNSNSAFNAKFDINGGGWAPWNGEGNPTLELDLLGKTVRLMSDTKTGGREDALPLITNAKPSPMPSVNFETGVTIGTAFNNESGPGGIGYQTLTFSADVKTHTDTNGDGNFDYISIDSDDDNCYDVDEVYGKGTDADGDGQYGTGKPAVNANGLVIAAGINSAGTAYTTTPPDKDTNGTQDYQQDSKTLVAISAEPIDVISTIDNDVIFALDYQTAGAGTDATIQWYVKSNGTGTEELLTDGTSSSGKIYSGVTTKILTVSNFKSDSSGDVYYAKIATVSYECDTDLITREALLTVTPHDLVVADDVLTVVHSKSSVTTASGAIDNDQLLGSVPIISGTGATAIFRVTSPNIPGITFDTATSKFIINGNVTPGVYNRDYEICEIDDPTNCQTGVITITVLVDTDFDGVANISDLDDDNDGILDTAEGTCVLPAQMRLGYISNSRDLDGDNGYTFDGSTMSGSLTQKIQNPANFGPSGIVSTEIILVPINDASITEALLNSLNLDALFIGGIDKVPTVESWLSDAEFVEIQNWSQHPEKSVITTQVSSTKWGRTLTPSNTNPDIPNNLGQQTLIFNGPFGKVTSFNQGGSYQAVFTADPTKNDAVLAIDQKGERVLIKDGIFNDFLISDVDILTTNGGVSSGGAVTNENDKLAMNLIYSVIPLSACPGTDIDLDGISNSVDLDSDGDGCNDITEAYGVGNDPDGDGVFGTGSPAVDADGKVVAASYGIPLDLDANTIDDYKEISQRLNGITTQPASQLDKLITETATFTVVPDIIGTGTSFEYQWEEQKKGSSTWTVLTDGLNYSGTTTNSLTVSNLLSTHDGNLYRTTIKSIANSCDTDITSNAAQLTILSHDIVTAPDMADLVEKGTGQVIASVLTNDLIGSVAATTSNVNISLVGTPQSGLTLNTTTGEITTNGSLTPGTYTLEYALCELADPTNCTTTISKGIVTVTVLTDSDGDLVADINDLDDDNDGVSDIVEGLKRTTVGTAFTSGSGTGNVTGTLSSASGSIVYDIAFQNVGNGANGGHGNASEFFNSGTEISCLSSPSGADNTFTFTPQGTAKLVDLEDVTIDVSYVNTGEVIKFSQPISNFTLKPGTSGNLSADGLTVTITSGSNSASGGFTAKQLATFVNPFVINGTLASDDTFTVKIAATIFDQPDADSDGIVNSLDIDADNDGCSDTKEAYGVAVDFGSNPVVDANGLVIAAGVTGTTYDNSPLDSNANAVFDFIEASKALIGISVQPTDHVTNIGKPVTFNVTPETSGSGTEISYQWQVNNGGSSTWMDVADNTNYSGVNTASLTITPTSTSFNGNTYRVQLSTPSYVCDADVTSLEPVLLINSNAISANNDAVTVVENVAGTGIVNVISNDKLDQSAVNIADVVLTEVSSSVVGLSLDVSTGNVNISNTVSEGIYFLEYQMCELVDPTNCSIANVTVVVQKDTDGDGLPDATDLDIDGDGNLNTTDPNPNAPVANNVNSNVKVGQTNEIDILANDDFIPGATTEITKTGGTAAGAILFDNTTGKLTYTPTLAEAGSTVTVIYQVENTLTNVVGSATVTMVVDDEADLSINLTVDSATPNVGSNATFTITVTNDGPSNATNVDVSSKLPSGYSYVSSIPSQGTYDAITGNWFVGAISNGANQTLTLIGTVVATGTYDHAVEVSFVDQNDPDSTAGNGNTLEDDYASVTVTPIAQIDLVTVLSVNDNTPNEGSQVTYQVMVSNNGPSNATNVVATFALTTGVTYISDDGSGAYNSGDGKWSIGQLGQGQSTVLHVVAVVDNGQAGNVIPGLITQVASGSENDSNASGDITTAPITVNEAALSTTISVDNATPNEGAAVKYTISIANAGPSDATGIELTSILPSGLTFVSDNGVGTYNSATGTWKPNTIVSAGNTSLEITAIVNSGTAGTTILTPVNGLTTDQTTTNILPSPASITVKSIDLVTTISVDNPTPNEGGTIKYNITISNNGPDVATNVSLTDVLPVGVTFVSDNGSGAYVAGTGIWTVGTIANAASTSLEITATVDGGTAGAHIVNTITSVSATETDIAGSGDTLSSTISVTSINLVTVLGVVNPTPNVNDSYSYTITVTNNGPGDATGVSLTSLIPSGLTYTSSSASTGTYLNGTGVWTIGSIANGSAAVLTINATINSDQGNVLNTISTSAANGNQTDSTIAGDILSQTFTPTSANLITVFSVNNPTPDEGDTIEFTVKVKNAGPSDETNVSITTDTWPLSGITYSSDDGLGAYINGSGVWTIGSLAAGATATLKISGVVNIATGGNSYSFNAAVPASGDQIDLVSAGDVLSASIAVQRAKLATSISVNNPSPNVGASIVYTITVKNNGPSTDNNVSLTSLLPSGLTFISATSSTGSYNNGSGLWSIGSLINGASESLNITASVDAGQGGNTINSSTTAAVGDHTDTLVSNPNLNTSITVTSANLVTIKSVNNTLPDEGSTIIYSIQVTNNGPNDETNVSLTDVLPVGVTYVSESASQGSYDEVSGLWSIGTILNGDTKSLLITATVDPGTSGSTITNTTTGASGDQSDPTSTGDVLTADITVTTSDILTVMSVSNPTPNVGDTIIYEINVSNNGPNDDTNVSLTTEALSALSGVTYVSDDGAGSYVPATGVWTIGSILSGNTKTLKITATVDANSGGQTITNSTTAAAGDQGDPSTLGDVLSATIFVTSANLITTIVIDNANPNEGDTVNYTIYVNNNGPNDETNVSLEDHLPSGITFVNASTSNGSYSNVTGIWDIGSIPKYTTVSLVLSGTIDSGQNGQTITNTIINRASGDQSDPTTAADVLSASLTVSSANLVTVISVDNLTPNEGDTIIYKIVVTNNGPNDESSISLTSLLPPGINYSSSIETQGSYNSSNGIWSIGDLTKNSSETISILGTVAAGASLLNPITTNTTAANGNIQDSNIAGDVLSVTITVTQSDLITSISVDNPTPNEGDLIKYTLNAANNGPNNETNASLTFVLPVGLTYVSDSGLGTYNGTTGLWTIGSISKNNSKNVIITAEVNPNTSGSTIVANTTAAKGDQADPITTTDVLSTSLTVGNYADIVLSKIVDNSTPNEGDVINYTIRVTNNGPANVTNLVISDVVPAGLTFVNEFAGSGIWDTGASTWTLSSLASGETKNLILQASVNSGTGGTDITNTISNTQDQIDSNATPDDLSETIAVTQVDLYTEKSVDNPAPNEGDIVTYAIKVTNAGSSDTATNVLLTDVMPLGVTYVSDNGNGTYNNGSGAWSIGTLAQGASKTLLIDASVNAGTGGTTITNTTSAASADQADSDATPDSLTAAIIVTSTDLVTVKSVDVNTPTEGQTIVYSINVNNNAGSDATGVSLIDRLPIGVTYVSDDAGGNYNATSGIWNVGAIAAGANQSINITATVDAGTGNTTINNTTSTAKGNQTDPTIAGDILSAAIHVVSADLVTAITADLAEANIGDIVTYSITVTNNGPSAASSVTLTDLLPAGVTYISDTSGGSYDDGTGVWSIGAIANGASETIAIAVTVDAASAGKTITNVIAAAASGAEADPTSANDVLSATFNVISNDLETLLTVDKSTPNEGDTIVYTLSITNNGPSAATGVLITDNLPTGVNYVGHTTLNGTFNSGAGIWDIGTLAKNAVATLTISAEVAQNTGGTTIVNATSDASADFDDPNTANNASSVSIVIGNSADVVLTNIVDNGNPNVGETVTFTITATNNGPTTVQNLVVANALPTGLSYGIVTPSSGTWTPNNWTIGALANGDTETLTITATIDAGTGGQTLTNVVANTQSQTDTNSTADDFDASVTVTSTNLVTTKTVNNSMPNEGDTVVYTISVTNNGPSDATGVSLTDILPSGITYLNDDSSGAYNIGSGIWMAGNIANGATVKLNITATVDATTGGTSIVNLTTTAKGDQTDPTTSGDDLDASINVTSAELVTTMSVDNATPNEGEVISYTINVRNQGPNDASNVNLTTLLPSGVTFNSFVAPLGTTYNQGSGFWNIGTISSNSSKVLQIKAIVNVGTGGTTITNTTNSAIGDQSDPDTIPDILTTDITVANSSDIVVSKTVDNTTPNVGDLITFTVVVENKGGAEVHDFVLRDVLPNGLTFGTVTASAGTWNAPLWSITKLATNDPQSLTVQAVVGSGTGGLTLVNSVSHIQTQTDSNVSADDLVETIVITNSDIQTVVSIDNTTPNEGDSVTYSIVVTNNGGSDATGISMTDNLPGGLTYGIATVTQGNYNVGSGLWTIGDLVNGASATFNVTGVVNPGTGGTIISNSVTAASGDQSDPATAGDVLSVDLTVTSADLVTEKTVDNTSPNEGDVVVYTINVTNNGIDDATNVSLIDVLPVGLTYLSDDSGNYDATTGLWTIGTITTSGTASINISARVDSGTGGLTITNNTTAAEGDQSDPTISGDVLSATITVTNANLVTTIMVDNVTPNEGDTVTYTISVVNNGPSDATGVSLIQLLPSGVTYLSDDASGAFDNTTGVWIIGALASGATHSLKITTSVDAGTGGATIVNSITAANGNESDPTTVGDILAVNLTVTSTDLVTVKTVTTSSVNGNTFEGEVVTYTITVYNNGPSEATNVGLTDNLPVGVTYLNHSTQLGIYNTGSGHWAIGSIPSGDSVGLSVSAIVDAGTGGATITNTTTKAIGDQSDPTDVNNKLSADLFVSNASDIYITKIVDNTTPNEGDVVTYTITATNKGPAAVTNLDITDALPSGLTYGLVTPSQGTWTAPVWNLSSLLASSSATLTVQTLVGTGTGGQTLVNTITKTHDQLDSETTVDDLEESITVTSSELVTSKLVVIAGNEIQFANEGDVVTYIIEVQNVGPSKATNVKLTDILPNSLTYESDNGNGTYNSGSGLWTIGDLANGDTKILLINASVNSGTSGQVITNTTSPASGDQSDPNNVLDDLEASFTVKNESDIVLTKTVDILYPNEGETVTYTVTVTNNSGAAATNLVITDTLPSGLLFGVVTPSQGTWTAPNWNVGTLNPGQTAIATIQGIVDFGTQGLTLINKISNTQDQTDTNASQDNDTATISVTSSDLEVVKTVSNQSPNEGDAIVYTINVENLGPDNASGVFLTDLLPPGVTYVGHFTNTGTYNQGTGLWSIGAISNTDSATLSINVTVDTGTSAVPITNTVENLTADQADPNLTNNTSSVVITPGSSIDLSLVQNIVNPQPSYNAGETINFEILLKNDGPNLATGVQVTTVLPSGFEFVNYNSALPYDAITGIWNIGAIGNQETKLLFIEAKILGTGDYSNCAEITAADQIDSDSTPGNGIDTEDDYSCISILPGTTADLAITQSIIGGNTIPKVGDEIALEIRLVNNGPVNATGVQVTDILPVGFSLVNYTPTVGSFDEATGIWNVGSIEANVTHVLILNVEVSAPGDHKNCVEITQSDQPDNDIANNSACIETSTVAIADLVTVKSVDNTTPNEGDTIVYTIEVTNNGINEASNVSLVDVLPTGVSYLSDDASGNYDAVTGIWSIGTLPNAANVILSISAIVDNGTGGTSITNTAIAAIADQADPSMNGDVLSATIDVTSANLVTTITVDNTLPNEGETVVYTITVVNNGPSTATAVRLLELLPAGLSYVGDDGAGAYDVNSGVWNLGTVNSGITHTLKISATIDSGTGGTTIDNIITAAAGNESDPSSAGDSLTAALTVTSADIAVAKAVSNQAPNEGETISYTITVENQGPSDASGVVITDQLPTGVAYLSHTTNNGSFNHGSGLWTIGDLTNGMVATLTIDVMVNIGTNGTTITNTVNNLSADQSDPIADNNSASVIITPGASIDLSTVQNIINPQPSYNAGEIISFELIARNDGSNKATGVQITNTLPSGLEFVTYTSSQPFNAVSGIWDVGTMDPQETKILFIEAKILGTGDYTNCAEITAADQVDVDSTPGNGDTSEDDYSCITISPELDADLALSQSIIGNNLTPQVGDLVAFEILLVNNGPVNATGVQITDVIPSGFTFLNYASTIGTYDATTGIWEIANLETNIPHVLILTLEVKATGDYRNCAQVISSDQPDSDVSNNTACVEANPVSIADLELTINVDEEKPIVGTSVTFTITVSNKGPSIATGIEVTNAIPSGYQYMSHNASIGIYDDFSGVWTVGSMNDATTEQLEIMVQVLATGDWLSIAEITAANEGDPDSTPENGVVSEDDMDQIKLAPDILLKISEGFTPNGDGLNDLFVIENLQVLYPNFAIEIMNRYGVKVYEYKHNGNPNTEPNWWDGRSTNKFNLGDGILPSETYFYLIHFNNNDRKPQTGWVYLRD